MRRLGRLGTAVLFVASAGGVSIAAARAAGPGDQAREVAPWGAEVGAPVALLSRLHHAAEREVQLGDLAEASGSSPATRAYGTQLAADFRKVDQRIVATAASAGIDEAKLSAVAAGENVVALKKEADDLRPTGRRAGHRLRSRFLGDRRPGAVGRVGHAHLDGGAGAGTARAGE